MRAAWPCLDSSLACLAAPEPACARSLADTAAWLLQPQVQTLIFLIYCTLHYMPGDGAGEPELDPAAGPEGGCAEPGPGAPGSQRRGGVAGGRRSRRGRRARGRTNTLTGEQEESEQEREDYASRAPERWEQWERVLSQFKIFAATFG